MNTTLLTRKPNSIPTGNSFPAIACIIILMSSGCGTGTESVSTDSLQEPSTRQEAQILMARVDKNLLEHRMPEEAADHIRRRMTGRLITAGLEPGDVQRWIRQ